MPTGDARVNIYDKKLMPQEAWEKYFFTFLDGKINDTTRAAFLSKGVLSDEDIGLTGPANDQFGVDLSDADRGIDGDGHIMDLGFFQPTSDLDQYFENAAAVDYWVGFRYQEVPIGIQNNPRSAEPEYPYFEDTIGEKDNPDSVTDNTTYIRLVLNGMLESGVDHSRKAVKVWLDNPVAPSESLAYYTGVVEYSAPDNYVDIPYTGSQGPLGQTAPTFPISTTASDYWVHVEGLSWFRNYDIRPDDDYVVIGKVQGSGAGTTPTVFDLSDQVKTFLISLQRAYYGNSPDTPAPGRTIIADRGSVILRQSATSNREYDDSNTGFLFDGLGQDDVAYQFPWMSFLNEDASLSSSYSAAKNLADGTDLLNLEAVTLTASLDLVTFTRGAVNLVNARVDTMRSSQNITFLLLDGTSNDQDGLYIVEPTSITTNTLDVVNLDGSAVSWTADTGNARILMLTQSTIAGDFYGTGANSDQGSVYHRIARDQSGLDLAMFGPPNDSEKQRFARIGITNGNNVYNDYFFNLFWGSMVMRGGKDQNIQYQDHTGTWKVRGHAHFQSDKQSGLNDFVETESYDEWGFDYRGNEFGLESATDRAPYQWASTARLPFWKYDGGNEQVHPYEPFTRLSNDTLTLTRGSVDLTYLPCDSNGCVGAVIVEVQYSTPNSADGVYVAYHTPATDELQLRKMSGGTPTFPVGSGNVRLFGGVITGPNLAGQAGPSDAWTQTITPSTPNMGGQRLVHYSGAAATANDWRYLLYLQDEASPMFGVRDGGQTYARAITTKSAYGSSGITQWDQIVTSLLYADEVDLEIGASRQVSLSTTAGNTDFIAPRSGTWTVSYTIPIFGGQNDSVTNARTYGGGTNPSALLLVTAGGSLTGYYTLDFKVQQGCEIQFINSRINPARADGTSASYGMRAFRQPTSSSTMQDLLSTGWVYANGGTGIWQNLGITCDQNNTDVQNSSYMYRIHLKTSASGAGTTTDQVRYISVQVIISSLGEHMLYK